MQTIPAKMRKDERPIQAIATGGGEAANYWEAGRAGITRIVPYKESGQIWFAIYRGNHLEYRVNMALIEYVWYGKASEPPGITWIELADHGAISTDTEAAGGGK